MESAKYRLILYGKDDKEVKKTLIFKTYEGAIKHLKVFYPSPRQAYNIQTFWD